MKKNLILSLTLFLSGASLVFAEPPEGDRGPPPGGGERPSKEELIERFDTDGDGELSQQERKAARESMQRKGKGPRGPKPGKQAILERFDTDGDGQLNETERAEAKAAAEQRRQDMIARFDTDGDGELSKDERMAARKELIESGERSARSPSQGKAKGKSKGPSEVDETTEVEFSEDV